METIPNGNKNIPEATKWREMATKRAPIARVNNLALVMVFFCQCKVDPSKKEKRNWDELQNASKSF